MNEYFQAFLRHAAAGAGVWLLNHGYATQSGAALVSGGILTAGMFVWSLFHKKGVNELKANQVPTGGNAAGQSTPGGLGPIISMLFLMGVLSLVLFTGCGHATLEAGGAYAPADTNGVATGEADYDLFVVDSAFSLAHDAAAATFNFERNNRAMLWKISPSIKHSLDQARASAKTVDLQYAVARSAYLANPIPANLGTLQQLLAKAQQLTTTAQAVIASQGSTGPPTVTPAPGTNAPAK
ncbi:MAG TPA: hypothetical protein VHA37_04540 [Candidatus Saccharimonadales bacterium]|nr:hypothetical protein [Candidatus Saccharimonadales bacterium]